MSAWSHKRWVEGAALHQALRTGFQRVWVKATAMAMAGFCAGFVVGAWVNFGMPMMCH